MTDSVAAPVDPEGLTWSSDPGPDIFIGLIGAMGTDLDLTERLLEEALKRVNYAYAKVRFSSLLQNLPGYEGLSRDAYPIEEYYNLAINGGNAVCKRFKSNDALAQMAILEVVNQREKSGGAEKRNARRAFIFHSLKRSQEIALLRSVYGDLFYCIAVYADEEVRVEKLRRRICDYYGNPEYPTARAAAQQLVTRDLHEDDDEGQDVRGAFTHADFFIRSDDEAELNRALDRFVSLVFDEAYISPSKSEIAMMHAKTAALRSVDLSRQVGAAVIARDGRLLTTGCNEVPRAGGGQYWAGDEDDARDFQIGYDTNDRKKKEAIIEMLARLTDYVDEKKLKQSTSFEAFYKELSEKKLFEGTRIDSLIEFGRIVHAEMAAMNASCVDTISIRDADLYCTTFPCHMCTRQIINVGIRNVFYIEPYPKSATRELYRDSVDVNPQLSTPEYNMRLNAATVCDPPRVFFLPFEGVAPRRYHDLFTNGKRKQRTGDRERFEGPKSKPRNTPFAQKHFEYESLIGDRIGEEIEKWRQEMNGGESK